MHQTVLRRCVLIAIVVGCVATVGCGLGTPEQTITQREAVQLMRGWAVGTAAQAPRWVARAGERPAVERLRFTRSPESTPDIGTGCMTLSGKSIDQVKPSESQVARTNDHRAVRAFLEATAKHWRSLHLDDFQYTRSSDIERVRVSVYGEHGHFIAGFDPRVDGRVGELFVTANAQCVWRSGQPDPLTTRKSARQRSLAIRDLR